MEAVAEAIRQELLRLLAEPLTGRAAARVGRLGAQAARLLGLDAGAAVDATMGDPTADAGEMAAGDTMETTGIRAIRELVTHAPSVITAMGNAPEKLTGAIAHARATGMTDVADELERRLLGKASEVKPYRPAPSAWPIGVDAEVGMAAPDRVPPPDGAPSNVQGG